MTKIKSCASLWVLWTVTSCQYLTCCCQFLWNPSHPHPKKPPWTISKAMFPLQPSISLRTWYFFGWAIIAVVWKVPSGPSKCNEFIVLLLSLVSFILLLSQIHPVVSSVSAAKNLPAVFSKMACVNICIRQKSRKVVVTFLNNLYIICIFFFSCKMLDGLLRVKRLSAVNTAFVRSRHIVELQ